MKIAIIGFSGSGKSTVFSAITDFNKEGQQKKLDSSKPSIGTVKVKDERLEKINSVLKSKKITPEELIFTDLPGFNLTHIRDAETLMHVVGVFSGRDYAKDIENMETEFMISDLAIIEKKLPLLEKELMSKPSTGKELEKRVLIKCKNALDKNGVIKTLELNADEEKSISGYCFLSQKAVFIVSNLDESQRNSSITKEISAYCKKRGLENINLCAKVESEIQSLKEEERQEFAKEMGVEELGAAKVVKTARNIVGLITFFTGSPNAQETRAWPIPKGTTAHDAAGKIHTDMKRGFIKAEVVTYCDFIKCGSFAEAKNKGLLRLEGKEYIVKDGDIITFKFNV